MFLSIKNKSQNSAPFGSGLINRNFSVTADKYRFSFNGKLDDEETNFQDYGMRMFDKRKGQFISVDPIAAKYPWLSTYQFASNTPIWAIDIDGLEAFFVHGTKNSSERWSDNPQTVQTLLSLTNNMVYNTGFNWKANLLNKESDRTVAAKQLAKYVLAHRVPGEEITLIGHSHGGSLAIQASKYIYKETGQKVNIVTVSSPAYNKKDDIENPVTNQNYINEHIALYTDIDDVQGLASGDHSYKNGFTKNYKINLGKLYSRTETVYEHGSKFTMEITNGIAAHSFDVDHPNLIEQKIKSGEIKKLDPVNK